MTTQRGAAWSRYWAGGAEASLPLGLEPRGSEAIMEFWREPLLSLRPSESLLDVGCGNGALARLFCQISADASALPRYVGVDLARLSPASIGCLGAAVTNRIELCGGIAAESLPFPDDSFALAVSQYGVEYTDLRRSLAELRRVLRPQARVAFLIHHPDSLPVARAKEEIPQLASLLASGGFLDRSEAMLPHLTRLLEHGGLAGVQADPAAEAVREAYDYSLAQLTQSAMRATTPDALLDARAMVGECFAQLPTVGASVVRRTLENYRKSLVDSHFRLTELIACAMSEEALRQCLDFLSPDGLNELAILKLRARGHLIGWGVTGRMP